MLNSNERKEIILSALEDLDGVATTRQIAERAGLNINVVSQTLGSLQRIECLGGRRGRCKWELKDF
jgi:DNA-binding transcriptional regulator YhcF (GntR family)